MFLSVAIKQKSFVATIQSSHMLTNQQLVNLCSKTYNKEDNKTALYWLSKLHKMNNI